MVEANRQLLERDQGVLEILAARDKELARAAEMIRRLQTERDDRAHEVEELNAAIAEMQSTRAWQTAERFRTFRAGLRRLVSPRKA